LASINKDLENERVKAREREIQFNKNIDDLRKSNEASQYEIKQREINFKLEQRKTIALVMKKRGYCKVCTSQMGGHANCGGNVFYELSEGVFGVCDKCMTHSTGWYCSKCKTTVDEFY